MCSANRASVGAPGTHFTAFLALPAPPAPSLPPDSQLAGFLRELILGPAAYHCLSNTNFLFTFLY